MVVEERMYLLQPCKVPGYFKLYENEAMAVQPKHLPHLVGCYVAEVGPQNLIVHL